MGQTPTDPVDADTPSASVRHRYREALWLTDSPTLTGAVRSSTAALVPDAGSVAQGAALFSRIESATKYVDRRQSGTTAAIVQAQPFGNRKSAGTTSKFTGGYYCLPQLMFEQTRTVVGEVGRQFGS